MSFTFNWFAFVRASHYTHTHTTTSREEKQKKITKLQQIQHACQTQLTSAKVARMRKQKQFEENKRALAHTRTQARA